MNNPRGSHHLVVSTNSYKSSPNGLASVPINHSRYSFHLASLNATILPQTSDYETLHHSAQHSPFMPPIQADSRATDSSTCTAQSQAQQSAPPKSVPPSASLPARGLAPVVLAPSDHGPAVAAGFGPLQDRAVPCLLFGSAAPSPFASSALPWPRPAETRMKRMSRR